MKAVEFCYWLQGYFELTGPGATIPPEKVKIIRDHLNLVFHHDIDPSYAGGPAEMQAIHDGAGIPQTPPHLAAQGIVARC